MFEDINKQLGELKEKIKEKERLRLRLKELKEQFEYKEKKVQELRNILNKEYKDVKRLENLSVGGLIYTLLGRKEEKLEKEKEEYVLAKVKYDEATADLRALEADIKSAEYRLKDLTGIEEEYDSLIKKKEEIILASHPENRIKLKELEEEIWRCQNNIKELKEATLAGDNLLDALNKVIDSLKSAANWGTFDMLGGGMLSTAIKHNHIDKAKENSYEVKDRIRKFQRELKDIDREFNLDINIGSFASFADFFFDGFFVDWYVQSSIKDALNNAENLKLNVYNVLNRIYVEKQESEEKLNRLKEEYKSIIEETY